MGGQDVFRLHKEGLSGCPGVFHGVCPLHASSRVRQAGGATLPKMDCGQKNPRRKWSPVTTAVAGPSTLRSR
jgi:hypothetical protein